MGRFEIKAREIAGEADASYQEPEEVFVEEAPVPEPKKKRETFKTIIWVCLLNGIAWIWFSYILAMMDKVQIAETLSSTAVTEILGVVLAYALKSGIENLSKHNSWPDKPGKDSQGVG